MKYVVELAKALAEHPAVHRVDLLTRLITDPEVDTSYGVELEELVRTEGELGGAYIVRIRCGPSSTYLRYSALSVSHVSGLPARQAPQQLHKSTQPGFLAMRYSRKPGAVTPAVKALDSMVETAGVHKLEKTQSAAGTPL